MEWPRDSLRGRIFFNIPSIGIMVLGENFRQIFGFKRLIRKVFRNKDLFCQRTLKTVLGQLRGVSWNGHSSKLPQSELYLRTLVGCKSTNFVVSRFISVVDEMRYK